MNFSHLLAKLNPTIRCEVNTITLIWVCFSKKSQKHWTENIRVK